MAYVEICGQSLHKDIFINIYTKSFIRILKGEAELQVGNF